MNKRHLLLTLCLSIATSFAQKQWTLQDCLDYALANNITLKKSQLQQQSATEDLKGAKAALLPSVSASTNQSLGYQPWKNAGISTVTNGVVNTKVSKTSYNGSYNVSGQWTVWNGNKNTNNVKLSKLSGQQAELQVAKVKMPLVSKEKQAQNDLQIRKVYEYDVKTKKGETLTLEPLN